MTEYVVIDTRFPKTIVNLITSERDVDEVAEYVREAYPQDRYRIVPADDAPPRLLHRYLKRPLR